MELNIIKLREQMKHDILVSIGNYEKKYSVPVFLTSSVLSEIQNEIKAAEMQEMLKGDLENGRGTEPGKQQDIRKADAD